MRFDTLMLLLLPLVLAAHNAEEYAQCGRFSSSFHGRLPGSLSSRLAGGAVVLVVGGAMVLVTLAAAVLSVAAYLSHRSGLIDAVKISIFALCWNTLGHVILSLLRRAVLPGTATAIAIVLPYSAVAVVAMHMQSGNSATQIAVLAAAGAVALPAIILVALAFSCALSRVWGVVSKRTSESSC